MILKKEENFGKIINGC